MEGVRQLDINSTARTAIELSLAVLIVEFNVQLLVVERGRG